MPPRKKFDALLERISITKELKDKIYEFAAKNNLTVSHIQRVALQAYLNARERRKARNIPPQDQSQSEPHE